MQSNSHNYKKRNQKNSKRLKIIQLDLNDKNSIIKFENEIKKINKIDFLINNAGINVLNEIYNIKKDLDSIFNINLLGPTWLTKLISIKMKKKYGRIVNISSIYGTVSKEKVNLFNFKVWIKWINKINISRFSKV